MPAASLPPNEPSRLASLRSLQILDTPSEPGFDSLVEIAAQVCATPIALINLIDTQRQWFKASKGLQGIQEIPRSSAFCDYTILSDEFLEVSDAAQDSRFRSDEFVIADPGFRFYAGVPLRLSDGERVGTICVIDRQPRLLDAHQRAVLVNLARTAVYMLEERRSLVVQRALNEEKSLQTDAMERREATMTAIRENVPLAIFRADLNGDCTYMNTRCKEIFGLDTDLNHDFRWHDCVHPEDLPTALEEWKRCAQEHHSFDIELRINSVTGIERCVQLWTKPFDIQGIPNFFCSLQDITDRQNTIMRLRWREEELRKLYDFTPAMLHSIDGQGRITAVSDSWLTSLGYTRDEVIGSQVENYFTAESVRHIVENIVPKVDSMGRINREECQIRTKSGAIIDVLMSGNTEFDGKGKFLRSLALLEDVTERNAVLRTNKALIDTISSLFLWTAADARGTIIEANDLFCEVSQYSREELIGQSYSLLKSNQHSEEYLVEVWQQISTGKPWHGEICNRAKDGSLFWLDSVIAPFYHADGSVERYVSIRTDITSRKRTEESLRTNQRILEQTGKVAGIGGWEFDLNTQQLYWTEETYRIYGVDLDHVPNAEELPSFYPPATWQIVLEAAAAAATHGIGWDMEVPFIQKGGRHIWVRSVCKAEIIDGRPIKLYGAFQDITERVLERRSIETLNERMSLATESGGIGIWEYDVATEGLICDPTMYRLYGVREVNKPFNLEVWAKHLHPDDLAVTIEAVENAKRGIRDYDSEFRIIRDDGEIRYLHGTGRVLRDEAGNPVRMIGINWDVTNLRNLTTELSEQHELMRVTLMSIGDAVITTDPSGKVNWLNPVAERMTGWTTPEATGRPLREVFHIVNEETRLLTENPVATCLEQGKIVGLANHTLLISRHGEEFSIEDSAAPIRNERGEILGVILVFHDVTEQRRLSGEISYRASHDALTGLVNRTEFESRLRKVLNSAYEDRSQHALMYIDLDQFKLVNDACGHSVGDELLQQISNILQEKIRARDTLARIGGDEFAVILEHCSVEQAQRIGQQICDRMDDFRFLFEGRRFRIGTSIGLVSIDSSWASTAALLQAADISCYAAKDAGRNRVHTWFDSDKAMRARHGETRWATRIEQALDENRFVLFAQRIDALDQAAGPLHAEVLLRMVEADGTLVLPGTFIPAAERFHLASRIDRWVLFRALQWLKDLPDLNSVDILCVNLSGQSIGDRAFHRHVIDTLSDMGKSITEKLCLEITETAAITNLADAAHFMVQVRALGVRIALDDFGAGASSFGYLKTLPIDYLKIDGQFITDLVSDSLDDAAVRCFADVAKVIGVKTIAEFVDKPEVLLRLKEIGIDYGQGFLLHRPMPIDELLVVTIH